MVCPRSITTDCCVAVARDIAREAVRKLSAGKVKGKTVKVRALED